LRTIQPRRIGRNLVPIVAVLRARCHGVPPMSNLKPCKPDPGSERFSNKRARCGAIGGAPAPRQVPPSSRQGRGACAQELAGQEHSNRIPTKGRPVIHSMCFASTSNRKRCIGKGRSV
jgi:hypothetical protein